MRLLPGYETTALLQILHPTAFELLDIARISRRWEKSVKAWETASPLMASRWRLRLASDSTMVSSTSLWSINRCIVAGPTPRLVSTALVGGITGTVLQGGARRAASERVAAATIMEYGKGPGDNTICITEDSTACGDTL